LRRSKQRLYSITFVGDLTPEQQARLLEIAERCPVSKMLRQSSEIASVLGESAITALV
jgi:uncharacterized OsmC-like protein